MKFNYDNIAISGKIATGTTTLFNNLKIYLQPLGWKFRSSGQIIREITKENLFPAANLAEDKIHRELEKRARNLLKNKKHWVVEGWLAGYIARDLKNVLKVLLICSEDSLRIDRVVNRDNVTVEEAKKLIQEREKANVETWKRLYGTDDFWNPKYFDLVIDTYSSGPLETVGKVLDKLGYSKYFLEKNNGGKS